MLTQTIETLASQEKQWCAVYASSRHENAVSERMTGYAIESFLPTYRAIRRWKNGCTKNLELPLFPNYLFVRINRAERGRVLQAPGVIALVGSGPETLPIPDQEIEALRQSCLKGRCEPHSGLAVGARVRIRTGAMEGLIGTLVRIKGNLRVVMSLDVIKQNFTAEINVADLEALPV
jgi:transcription antitermination factor NusG